MLQVPFLMPGPIALGTVGPTCLTDFSCWILKHWLPLTAILDAFALVVFLADFLTRIAGCTMDVMYSICHGSMVLNQVDLNMTGMKKDAGESTSQRQLAVGKLQNNICC